MPSPSFGSELVDAIRAHLKANGIDSLGKLKDAAVVIARIADELYEKKRVHEFVDKCEEEGDEYMSMSGFTKLFNSIVSSSIWFEPKETKLLWITMLALANKDGVVEASVPGLAHLAGLTREETDAGLKTLLSPDPDSRTKDAEGRRIAEVDGGWILINHSKYRATLDADARREYFKEQKRKARSTLSTKSENVHTCPHLSTQAEAEADTESDTEKRQKDILARKPRERNLLMDALAAFEDIPPDEVSGNGPRLAKAIKAIRAATPDVTPDEIRRRAANYDTHFPGLNRSATGLAKWWSKCHAPKDGVEPRSPEAEARLNAF